MIPPLRMHWEETSPGTTSEGVLLQQGGQYTLLSILHNSFFVFLSSPFSPFLYFFVLLLLCLLLLCTLWSCLLTPLMNQSKRRRPTSQAGSVNEVCLVGREQAHFTFNECSPRCDLPGWPCINYFIFLILCYFKKPKIWVFHKKNENFFHFLYEISRTYKCWQNNSHF